MKTKIEYLWHLFNKEVDCAVESVNSAQNYLDEPKKRRRWTPMVCFGPRSVLTKELIVRVCKSQNYPPIPLLADNKELRDQNKPREKSPLFRIAASAISLKYNNFKKEVKKAIEEEKSKAPPDHILYRLEPCFDEPKEEKEVHE
jgi:hypothetical protein